MKASSAACVVQKLFFFLGVAAVATAATITVTPTVTSVGSLFQYNYTIANGSGNDLAVLDITVTPGVGTIQSLAAPAGFITAYDSVLGLVSFLEDTSSFGSAPESGFIFDSPIGPNTTTFNATFADGSTSSGATTGPVSGVPEPGSLALCAGAIAAFRFWRSRSQALRSQ